MRAEVECALTGAEQDAYLDEATRTWIIDGDALNEVDNDLQTIVNCTREGDTVLFNTTENIRPSSSIIIPWSLAFGTYSEETGLAGNVSLETRRKTVLRCPQRNEGVFLIRSPHLKKNLIMTLCFVQGS